MRNQDKRVYNAVSLAGPLIDRGLTATDADALLGLLFLNLKILIPFLEALDNTRERPLLDLIPDLIEQEGDFLRGVAQIRRWQERKAKYEIDRAEWLAAEVGDDWRGKPMTVGQRYLVQSTAALLTIEIPAGMDRGSASDWLENQMAHLVLMMEQEFDGEENV